MLGEAISCLHDVEKRRTGLLSHGQLAVFKAVSGSDWRREIRSGIARIASSALIGAVSFGQYSAGNRT